MLRAGGEGRPGEGSVLHTLALARTEGGMILSGPKDCRGSIKDVRIFPHFLHSAAVWVSFHREN